MKKISQIETGGRFLYGGIEWVKLYAGDGTVAISAEPVFERAFDENNKNDWRSSSLRRELNGAFLDALVAEGADRAAFLDWESDLTADDGMTDYCWIITLLSRRSFLLPAPHGCVHWRRHKRTGPFQSIQSGVLC